MSGSVIAVSVLVFAAIVAFTVFILRMAARSNEAMERLHAELRASAMKRKPQETPAPPAKIELRSINTNPNPAPDGPPPVSQTRP